MKFIDTDVLVSSFFADEENHRLAKMLIESAISNNETVYYSDYILDEVLTLVRARKGVDASNEILDILINSEFKLLKIQEKHILAAAELFKKYDKLSFTDCVTITVMMENNILELYSFDRGFDGVPHIARQKG